MNCGYTDAVLDETLRDIFTVGLRNSNIQKELLAKPDTLSFKQVCDAAIQLETATKELVSQLTNPRSTAVNAIGARPRRQTRTRTARAHTARRPTELTAAHITTQRRASKQAMLSLRG